MAGEIELQRLIEAAWAKRDEWAKERPALGAQLGAMGREAAKDVRDTMFEVFFGHGDGHGEMGTPLNPTPQMVTNDLGTVYGHPLDMDGQHYHEQLEQASQRKGPEQDRGIDL